MKELTYTDNWNGGDFNFFNDEVLNKSIVIRNEKMQNLGTATITEVLKRYGSDGHNQNWQNVDYKYELVGDKFNRNTTILSLLKSGYKVFLQEL